MSDEFSVVAFYDAGWHEYIARELDAEDAVNLAKSCTAGACVERVIVTDGGDHTVLEWKRGEGVTFPKSKQGAA